MAHRSVRAENNGDGAQPIHNGDGNLIVQTGANSEQHIHTQTHITLSKGLHPSENPSRRDIIDWLEPQNKPDFLSHHKHMFNQVAPGTGAWLLESAEFQAWKKLGNNAFKFLWMHGISGSGKTISIAFESLKREKAKDGRVTCVYLHFDDGDGHQPMCADIFSNLFKQLLDTRESNEISTKLEDMYKDSFYSRKQPSLVQLQELFTAEVSTFERVYLVIDSMDNCLDSSAEETQNLLLNAINRLSDNVQVLITSRTDWTNGQHLGTSCRRIHVTPNAIDVGLYIRDRVLKDNMRWILKQQSEGDMESEVVERVTEATGGVFLLAKLLMDHLGGKLSLGSTKAALEKLPNSIEGAIDVLVTQIKTREGWRNRDKHNLARHALTWITHAITPLKEAEILYSYAIKPDRSKTVDMEFVPLGKDLISACAGLVIVDPDTKILRLVHESLHGYLEKHDMILPRGHLDMATKCLALLHFEGSRGDDESKIPESPLLEYAATHWITHIRRFRMQQGGDGDNSAEVEASALEFLRNDGKVRNAFKGIARSDGLVTTEMTGLHAAVYFNSPVWAKKLIQGGIGVNVTCTNGQTALHWAAMYARHELVDLLMSSDADPNIRDTEGNTPLHLAVTRLAVENVGVISALVGGGAAVNLRNKKGITPLEWAIRHRPHKIAWDLVQNLHDVNKKDDDGWTPLRLSMRWDRYDLICLLLDKKADVNPVPKTGDKGVWTPLGQAAALGHRQIVRRLLDAGADVNFRAGDGGPPLWLATSYGHLPVVRMLIHHKADVDGRGADGTTPLIQAVKAERRDMVLEILGAEVNLDVQDKKGFSALHYAIECRDRSILWLLVTNGADLGLRDGAGLDAWEGTRLNALDKAIEKGDLSLAWLLCENGAKLDACGGLGLTALHRAAGLGHRELVRLFLDRGALIDEQDREGMTALHHAIQEGHDEVAMLLVSQEASLSVQADDGSTALILATRKQNEAMVRILLNLPKDAQEQLDHRTASLDLQDDQGNSALHFAACSNDTGIVRLLGQSGADLDIRDWDGRTPLMVAAQVGKKDVVKQLLRCNADARARDHGGRTALDYTDRDNFEVWRQLSLALSLGPTSRQ
ncbi:uncharacterized protein DNG_09794 [Cephalotrichum gorgonifer]|uniref:Nephrocystin 3-like N-terminal domain-containing protein n=1 Tax=Cephalotrichum gorgonifer TaxID=2041049 RepID=A0AAE8N6D1_9PEZI|nr:uncharacterized protein DNG_09794 [Cephalotrichum gorgonifer]